MELLAVVVRKGRWRLAAPMYDCNGLAATFRPMKKRPILAAWNFESHSTRDQRDRKSSCSNTLGSILLSLIANQKND